MMNIITNKPARFLLSFILVFFFSCQKLFLEKPDTTGTLDLDAVYASERQAEKVLMTTYWDALCANWPSYPRGGFVGAGALGAVSGERSWGADWHETVKMVKSGVSASFTTEHYNENWQPIRKAYLIYENIDRVPDMSEQMKKNYKGEALALIAYRYMSMFIRYGGLPLVEKSFLPDDDLKIPRSSLQSTLNFIIHLCDQAIELLPDAWPSTNYGRVTKGAAMAIKARVLTFAARPLFNSATPPLSLGSNDSLICFEARDMGRYEDAILANEAVLSWAHANGYELINTGNAGKGNPNPFENAIDDYGTATSTPGNREVILGYKFDQPNTRLSVYYNSSGTVPDQGWETDNSGLVTPFLKLYYSRDGTTPDWPEAGESAIRPISDYKEKIENMEARMRLDYVIPGYGTMNNPGVSPWTLNAGYPKRVGNYAYDAGVFPNTGNVGKGCGAPAKFYYKAGTRAWFEPPLFRLAETYLNLAEAYNEIGQAGKALENLNMVHNRAGLPSITETNKENLRRLIWRENDIEFVGENHRFFNVKHWKHPDIDKGIIGGQFSEIQILTTQASPQLLGNFSAYWNANTYVGFWHPKMFLSPFSQDEVNKGITIQNPGY